MRKSVILASMLLSAIYAKAQYNMVVSNSGNTMYATSTSSVESITFDGTYAKIYDGSSTLSIQKGFVESFTFTTSTVTQDKIYIIYNGTDDATIINPYSAQGVTITASGGAVTVNAATGISDLQYYLLGNSSSGSLSITSDQNLVLNMQNLTLTSSAEPAININSSVVATINSVAGTVNTLSDSTASSINGTIYTAGSLAFTGTGTLNVNAYKKNGITALGTMPLTDTTLNIPTANGDAVHTEGFTMNSGVFTISPTNGDGIDAGAGNIILNSGTLQVNSTYADTKAVKADGTITVNGGTYTITASGDQSKGFSSKTGVIINSGTIGMTISGTTALEASGSGYDPSYASAIKSDGYINVAGGSNTLDLPSTNAGGKGLSADTDIAITGGSITVTTVGAGTTYTNESGVTDSYTSSGIKADGYISITAGTINLTSTGAGGKGLSADGTLIIGTSGADNSALVLKELNSMSLDLDKILTMPILKL